MSVVNLKSLLQPASVTLIGASENPASIGNVIMRNLLNGGFAGPVFPVNPKYKTVCGVYAYQQIEELPVVADLAVICTPANTVPEIIARLGKHGTRAAVVISAGFHSGNDQNGLTQAMLEAAKPYDFRILGPNCIGLLNPVLGLNASFAHTDSLPGSIAVISQSGAICTSILDWAKSRGIGFSYFISLGDSADVDFGDLLDYLGSDRHTKGILLYMESIKLARKFMSAARATARNKTVIVVKAGRKQEGATAATSHTGAMAGNDDVFDAAIRRAGMLRVYSIQNLFDAVESLAHRHVTHGNRLAIMTNGGGIGVLATDSLIEQGGRLAELMPETYAALNRSLPENWSHANPVDIVGDSDAKRYVDALKILMKDANADAILVMLVPVAVIDNKLVAQAVCEVAQDSNKTILTCWMGGDAVAEARDVFKHHGVPHYDTPEFAIRAFLQTYEYGLNQASLMQMPPSIPREFVPDITAARNIINSLIKEKREIMTEAEAKQLLASYEIPVSKTLIAKDATEAVEHANTIGYPVALKILSKDITHKSDVGGVLLNVESAAILQLAAEGMLSHIKKLFPDASIEGFTVQEMVSHDAAYELILGVSTDPVFGPVILFGQGGVATEITNDKAVALPPLNMSLAQDLIQRTRIFQMLKGFRDVEPVNLNEIMLTLLKISQLVVDHAEIIELDINPLVANSKGVIALDARVRLQETDKEATARLAICPYPKNLEEHFRTTDGEDLLIRPIKPEDEKAHNDFLHNTKSEDIYFRFCRAVSDLSHSQMARFTQIDYDREMAFIAVRKNKLGENETVGVIRIVSDSDNIEAEFALIVRSDMHKRGIGSKLMSKMIAYSKLRGIKRLVGETLIDNFAMQKLSRQFQFEETKNSEEKVVHLLLELKE